MTPDLTEPSVLRMNTEMSSYTDFIETRSLELQSPSMIWLLATNLALVISSQQ